VVCCTAQYNCRVSVNVKCQHVNDGLIRKSFSGGKFYNLSGFRINNQAFRLLSSISHFHSFSRSSERPIRAACQSSGNENQSAVCLPLVVKSQYYYSQLRTGRMQGVIKSNEFESEVVQLHPFLTLQGRLS
jgi:hypothetical protein